MFLCVVQLYALMRLVCYLYVIELSSALCCMRSVAMYCTCCLTARAYRLAVGLQHRDPRHRRGLYRLFGQERQYQWRMCVCGFSHRVRRESADVHAQTGRKKNGVYRGAIAVHGKQIVLSLILLCFVLSLMVLIVDLSLMVLILVLSLTVLILVLSRMVLIFVLSMLVLIFVLSLMVLMAVAAAPAEPAKPAEPAEPPKSAKKTPKT